MSSWTERGAACLLALALVGVGCRQDMHDQPSYSALEPSPFFADGTSARLPVPGTVARGQLRADSHLYRGRDGAGEFATTFPFRIAREQLDRGEQRYNVFCSPCHDRTGRGNGMVVQRGFRRRPPSLHDPRLREVPAGYLFDVISNGFGAMSDYAEQISVEDRWHIVAYLRALQLSQNATIDDVSPDRRGGLSAATGG